MNILYTLNDNSGAFIVSLYSISVTSLSFPYFEKSLRSNTIVISSTPKFSLKTIFGICLFSSFLNFCNKKDTLVGVFFC